MENDISLKIIFWIGTAIMTIAVISILLVVALYHNKIYKLQQKESDLLLKSSIESEKRERQRIASDLHDDISGDLTAISNYITVLDKYVPTSEGKAIVNEVASALKHTLTNVQNISYNLMPPQMETSGLIPTLKSYFERMRKWSDITIIDIYNKGYIPIDPLYKYEVLRIVQELMSNMQKYGMVSLIKFEVEVKDKETVITIEDNGTAFDFYEELKHTSGMGLKNILSRTRHIGAVLAQGSFKGGNRITIQFKNTL